MSKSKVSRGVRLTLVGHANFACFTDNLGNIFRFFNFGRNQFLKLVVIYEVLDDVNHDFTYERYFYGL